MSIEHTIKPAVHTWRGKDRDGDAFEIETEDGSTVTIEPMESPRILRFDSDGLREFIATCEKALVAIDPNAARGPRSV